MLSWRARDKPQKIIVGLIAAAVGLLLFSDLFPWGVVRWGVVKWLLVLLALVLYVLVMGRWGLAEERRLERKEQEEEDRARINQ